MPASTRKRRQPATDDTDARQRILKAAFGAFMEGGYAAASTLEIARRARVSKRELYSLVGNKQEMLIACISERARRFAVPPDLPVVRDRERLAQLLCSFGAQLVREASDPSVVGVHRLAIAEAIRAPEVARTLDSIGREASRVALQGVMSRARDSGLLAGRPVELAEQFGGLLWSDLMIGLLLGVAKRPSQREIVARARNATSDFLRLHPLPGGAEESSIAAHTLKHEDEASTGATGSSSLAQ
jgi:AcrR family transcriptional regulator